MSASTVSITATPGARRRPLVAGEKTTTTTSIELVGLDGNNGNGEDRVTGGSSLKDLSHSIRGGETVADRSNKDFGQNKKGLNSNSAAVPNTRRMRKVVSKPEKPKWLTVVSVLGKNFLLVVAVLGLVQMIKKLALNGEENVVGTAATGPGLVEVETRFAEMESFLKTTTRMLQVQMEVVDKKIENEVEGLKNELSRKIEDQGLVVENELQRLEDRTVNLEKSVGKLGNMLTKEEFEQFYEELKKQQSVGSGGRDLRLDDVRAFAREVIEKEIEKHNADGLGRVDYALASSGAVVVRHSEPYIVGKGSSWLRKTLSRNAVHTNAEKMLKPSFGEPGECFPLKGSSGFVEIKLRTTIVPEAVTLEHVAKSVAFDRSSAPKDCRISGWLRGRDTNLAVHPDKMFLLTEFTYDLDKSHVQTFEVSDSAGTGVVDTIRLDFDTNHGSPFHTCIYRLRVHGHEPDSVSMLPINSSTPLFAF